MMINPAFARALAKIGARHAHVSPLELIALYEQALSTPAVQHAILDAVDELILPAIPGRPLQATLHTDPNAARLFILRTDLRTIQRHTIHTGDRVSFPANLWTAFCEQADPESSPHYSGAHP